MLSALRHTGYCLGNAEWSDCCARWGALLPGGANRSSKKKKENVIMKKERKLEKKTTGRLIFKSGASSKEKRAVTMATVGEIKVDRNVTSRHFAHFSRDCAVVRAGGIFFFFECFFLCSRVRVHSELVRKILTGQSGV